MRFKGVLAALGFLFVVSVLACYTYIQTDTFGKLASKIISTMGEKKADVKISFKNIDLSFFPLGIELNQLKIRKKIAPDEKFQAELGKVGLYIGFFEFEERKISLGEVRISDSTVKYFSPDKKDTEFETIDQDIIDNIFDKTKNLPLRIEKILVENTQVFVNYDLVEVKRLKIVRNNDHFLTRLQLANLKPHKDINLTIDEIWADAEIRRKDIIVQQLRVQHDVHTLLVSGEIKNYPLLKGSSSKFEGRASAFLGHLKNIIKMPELIKIDQGHAEINYKAEIENAKINASASVSLKDFESNLFNASELEASLELRDDSLILSQLNLKNQDEKLKTISSVEIFNLKTKKILTRPIMVKVDHLDLNNALRILPEMNILKGKLTGELSFRYSENHLSFIPKDGFLVQNLGLVVGEEDPFTILMIKNARLSSTSFRLIGSEFQMESSIELDNSKIDVQGVLNSKNVSFSAKNAKIDLEDFGNIANLNVLGKGILNIHVSGSPKDASINFKGKTSGFGILGYKLGQADKDLTISFKDSSVFINRLEAEYKATTLSGTGAINYANRDIALGINSQKANFFDLKEILSPIFADINFLPQDLDMNAKVDVNIFGKTSLDQLKIKSDVLFTDLRAYGETINTGTFSIGLKNQVLSLSDLKAYKGKGFINGDFSYDLKTSQMKVAYLWDHISLSTLELFKKSKINLNGILSGSFKGERSKTSSLLKLEAKLSNTKNQKYNFEDSFFNLSFLQDSIKGDIKLLGQILTSDFEYSLARRGKSRVDLDIDIPDIRPFAIAVFGQHLEAESFSGNVKFNLHSQFTEGPENIGLRAGLEKLNFKHSAYNVKYSSSRPQFIIEDNQIKQWDLIIKEPDLIVKTKGSGRVGGDVLLTHEIDLNSKIIEILLSPILSAEGSITNIFKLKGEKNNYSFSASSSTKELNLTIDNVPLPLNKISYLIDFSDNRLVIHDLKTTLDNGQVGLKGDLFFDDADPDLNIKFYLDKAEIPILGKSIVNLTGEGIILGNGPPYNISGEIIVNRANIVNELNEFSSKSNALSQVRFLPPSQESPLSKLVNLNLNVKTDSPIKITNSLMDVALAGELMLIGSPTRPRADGSLSAPANSSRIFFKNNEYFLSNADINFSPKKEISNPDFDVQAVTNISSYKVTAKAYGDLERFNFDLTSDPPLPRNSILSLIAFGYSDEIQSTLTQDQQQNLTQVGVGSFVFDRFKISDILNKQFGLQVNLGTVFEQSETESLLSGRNQDGQGALGRTRTATKIELKKRLDESLNLSVSSTMGGSIGQRQSMNLNYSINKKVQLEGVYELRTNADNEEDRIDSSIGGDIKFRWTFK